MRGCVAMPRPWQACSPLSSLSHHFPPSPPSSLPIYPLVSLPISPPISHPPRVLEYYYRGVASWEWYYPFHFSPPASDLQALSSVDVAFRVGAPFRPFQQLLSVLPRSSAALLPEPYR